MKQKSINPVRDTSAGRSTYLIKEVRGKLSAWCELTGNITQITALHGFGELVSILKGPIDETVQHATVSTSSPKLGLERLEKPQGNVFTIFYCPEISIFWHLSGINHQLCEFIAICICMILFFFSFLFFAATHLT